MVGDPVEFAWLTGGGHSIIGIRHLPGSAPRVGGERSVADVQDVIVVGAGPAGNNAALGLAGMGYGVTVIDWRHDVGDKLCTGIVGQECIRRFPVDPSFIYRETASAQVAPPCGGSVRFEAARREAWLTCKM